MTAREIALALDGQRAQRLNNGSYLVPCPVPSHGKGRGDRSPSLHISDGQTRVLFYCFAGCDSRDVLHALRRRGLFERGALPGSRAATPGVSKSAERPAEDSEAPECQKHRIAAWLWSKRQPIRGTAAEHYLHGRGISCALPPTLAFLPALDSYPPAM